MGLLPLITVPALPWGRACKHTAQIQSVCSAHNLSLKNQELPRASDIHPPWTPQAATSSKVAPESLHNQSQQIPGYRQKPACQADKGFGANQDFTFPPKLPRSLTARPVISTALRESLVYNMPGPTVTIKICLLLAYKIWCSATVIVKDGNLNDYTWLHFISVSPAVSVKSRAIKTQTLAEGI